MKASISVEFTDDELRKHAEGVATHMLLRFIREATNQFGPGLITMMFQQAIEMGARAGQVKYAKRRVAPEADRAPADRAPADRAGGPYVRTAERASRQDEESGMMTACLHVAESAAHEEGWGCCSCGCYNSAQRAACRGCNHTRCDRNPQPNPPPPSSSPSPPPPSPEAA
jgi:hypothetical protein